MHAAGLMISSSFGLSLLRRYADEMPVLAGDGISVRMIAESLLGASSSVQTSTPTFYADAILAVGTSKFLRRWLTLEFAGTSRI
jgi:hypothetical protein